MEARLKQDLTTEELKPDPIDANTSVTWQVLWSSRAEWIDYARALEADLARERERHQELLQVVKKYRVCKFKISHKESCIFRAHHDCRCDVCIKADALLEPQPAPVATQEEK